LLINHFSALNFLQVQCSYNDSYRISSTVSDGKHLQPKLHILTMYKLRRQDPQTNRQRLPLLGGGATSMTDKPPGHI